jgi:hypothetical protein
MPTEKQQDMGSGDPRKKTGGMGTSHERGGEHGEKRPTNADHDQKVARNRAGILNEEERDHSRTQEHTKHGRPSGSADDVLGQTQGRRSPDPDHERKSGDIVSGREHSQFPSSQAGYDDRTENERPPEGDDLSRLDKDRNDDLGDLDRQNDEPMK